MKIIFKLIAILLLNNLSFSQDKACEFEIDIATDTSSTRVLKDKIIDETILENTTTFLTFKLFEVDGVLGLNFQYLQKSKNFLTPICIDKNTKIYVTLANGNQVKLINSTETETCNDLQYDEINKNNVRILAGFFYFTPENFKQLSLEKVNFIKLTASTGDINFVIKPQIISEIYKETSTPETYFIDNLKCFGI